MNSVERYKQRRDARLEKRGLRIDADGKLYWITTERGTHIPLDERGVAVGGPLKGRQFSIPEKKPLSNSPRDSKGRTARQNTAAKVSAIMRTKDIGKKKEKLKKFISEAPKGQMICLMTGVHDAPIILKKNKAGDYDVETFKRIPPERGSVRTGDIFTHEGWRTKTGDWKSEYDRKILDLLSEKDRESFKHGTFSSDLDDEKMVNAIMKYAENDGFYIGINPDTVTGKALKKLPKTGKYGKRVHVMVNPSDETYGELGYSIGSIEAVYEKKASEKVDMDKIRRAELIACRNALFKDERLIEDGLGERLWFQAEFEEPEDVNLKCIVPYKKKMGRGKKPVVTKVSYEIKLRVPVKVTTVVGANGEVKTENIGKYPTTEARYGTFDKHYSDLFRNEDIDIKKIDG